jgi:hypothetical protein
MSNQDSDTKRNDKLLLRHLRELIDALDRRVPQMERVGEAQIANDARALREKAVARLAELNDEV